MGWAMASLLLLSATGARATDGEIPPRPEDISFEELKFEPPMANEFRQELSNGIPVYLAPSQEFPLVTLTFHFRGGSYLEPASKAGLAGMTGALIRRGGSESMSAEEMDEEFDFLAAQASSFCGGTQSGASLNCLKSNFDEALALFLDMLRRPRFQEDRIRLQKDQALESMKQRNDDAGSILAREWDFLLYGEEHFQGRVATQASIDSITAEDLRMFHQQVFHTGNMIISATGDFSTEEMLARLEKVTADWPTGEAAPLPPEPTEQFSAGVFRVEKDIPQGKINLGMRSVQRDHPDAFALRLMNEILGGGGFTSRITSRVRSDEGLAYTARSSLSMGTYYPGEFRAFFQSKSPTVALAIKIIFEEIERIRNEPVSAEELETAKNSMIETFPRTFESKAGTLRVFVGDEMTGRAPDYWKTYRDNMQAVTQEDIQRVAQEHLKPENMAIMVVGKWEDIEAGEERASMADISNGVSTEIPLRDPMTMQPVSAEGQ